jgi:hypothetical protein
MVKQFRVLTISKETKTYDTDLLRGIFGCNSPSLDVVDTLPPNVVIKLINNEGWKSVRETPFHSNGYICIPFVK